MQYNVLNFASMQPSIAQLEERETVMGYPVISRSLVRSRLEGLFLREF